MKTTLLIACFSLILGSASVAHAANTVDPNTTGATDVVQDPNGASITLTNPLADLLDLGADDLAVGNTLSGELLIDNGSSVLNSIGSIGRSPGSTGVATVNGDGSQWNNSSALSVGIFGNGTLNVEAGGLVSNTVGNIGLISGSTGVATVTGSGSTWTNTDSLYFGGNNAIAGGIGALNITDSGAVTVANTTKLWGSGDTLNLDGGTLSTGSFLNTSGGTFNFDDGELIVDGGTLDQGAVDLILDGAAPADNPTLTLIHGATTANVQDVRVGNNNQGTLNVEAGGVVSNTVGNIGFNSGSTGVATVTGSGSQWNSSDSLYLGGSSTSAGGSGNLTVQSGGLVDVVNLVKVWNTAQVNLAAGTINATQFELAGGTLSGFGTVNAEILGGSTIHANGGVLTVGNAASAQGFSFTGTTTISNSGTLEILDADSAELGTTTTLAGGALVARNGITLGAGQIVSGYGIILGSVTGPGNFQIASVPTGNVDFRGTLNVGADILARSTDDQRHPHLCRWQPDDRDQQVGGRQ